MQAGPVYGAYRSVAEKAKSKPRVIYLSPQGKTFSQSMAEEFAQEEELIFLCGHYEGIDERVLEEIVTDYVSIGDYVLTGGELPAMVMIDAVSRLIPGVLHNDTSAEFESFQDNLLEYPQYTRPEEWHGKMCIRDRFETIGKLFPATWGYKLMAENVFKVESLLPLLLLFVLAAVVCSILLRRIDK